MPRRPLFTFLPNYLQFFASKCSILGVEMFNSRAKISSFPLIYKYLREEVFCAAFARFLFPLPTNAVGRYDEAAVLIGMQDAAVCSSIWILAKSSAVPAYSMTRSSEEMAEM